MSKEHFAPTIESVGSKYLQDLQERIQSATKDYKTVSAFNRDFSDLMALGYTDDTKHKEALRDPAYLEGLVTKKSYFTLIKDLQSVQERIQNKLIALPKEINDVDRKKIEHSLSSDAANLKRVISLLEKPQMRTRMLNMEKKSHGLHEDYLIGNKSISSLDFLGKLSKKKLSVLQLGRLYPMLMRVLTERRYFLFTSQDRLKRFEITKTFQPTDIVRSPFGPFYVDQTTTNLHHGSIEQDLVLLKITDESLFDIVWTALSEAIIDNASEKERLNTDRDDLISIKGSIEKAAKKLIDYEAGGPPDKTDSSPARPTELSSDEEARRQELIRLTNGHNPTIEIPLLNDKLQSGTITNDEMRMLNLLTELQNLQNKKVDLSQDKKVNDAYLKQQAAQNKKLELEAKRDELKKIKVPTQDQLDTLREIEKQIDELDANEPYYDKQLKMSLTENQKKSLRFIGESIYESMMKTADSLSGKEKDEEKNIAFWSLRFIQSCHSIQTYLTDFYKPLIEEERKKLKKSHTDHDTSHDAHHDHADDHDEHAVMEAVEKKMQTIISNIITNTLSPVIESGGEPAQDFEHQQGHLAFQGQPPTSKLHIIMRALTRLKMEGSRLKELPEGLKDLPFVNAYRRQDKVWDQKERRFKTEYFGRVQHEIGKTGELFFKHARDLEEFFEVFFLDIIGNNDIRAQISAGKDFYKEVHSGKLNVFSRSKQFDTINSSDIGPEIAAVLPTCKTLLISYFAEMGWLTDEELERDLSSPKGYLNTMVGDFMKSYYPHYPDNKRNMITYIAVKQAYLHSMYQLPLSHTRYRAGFSGGKHLAGNMYFNDQVMSDKFAGSLAQFNLRETIDHKNFAKGGLHAPSGGQGMAVGKRGFEAIATMDNEEIKNYNDVLYGGIMYDLSGEYGRLLQKFNPKLEHHLPESLQPQNRFRNGSDDNLRGWRQLKKSKDNVSHILYTYGMRKDWVIANNAYTQNDHFTLIWKSVENLGINYLRTWTEDLMLGKYHEGKFRDLNKFLFRRYFQNTQLAGIQFGSKILSGSGFENATTDEDFASLIHQKIYATAVTALRENEKTSHLSPKSTEYQVALQKSLDSESESVLKDVFYRAHMVLMAERTPTILMDATNSWSEQTGVTLLDDIKMSIVAGKENNDGQDLSALFEAESSPDSKNMRFASAWLQTKRDLIFIQQNARKESIAQMMKKRASWEATSSEKNGLDSNIFGDFAQDNSDIELIEGSGKKGFVITDEFIRAKLSEHYIDIDPAEREKRIARVLAMRKLCLRKILETPDLPDYNKLKAAMESRLDKADKAVSDADKAKFKAQILSNIGSSEAEYRAKHSSKLTTRSKHFMDAWTLGELTFEPEADPAENFMRYENADANHIGRMAGITEVTSIKSKADLAYDAETSINEAIKNWGKDPIKAIDTMAEYLNKYYHTIEDERGDKFALDYKGWYVNRCIQMAMEEEDYRRGFKGVLNNIRAIFFKQSKKSFAGGKNQPFTSQSLGALKTREVIRYMIQKKLIGAEQGNEYMKRYRATYTDIILETLPSVSLIALGALAINLFTTAAQKDGNLKSSH